MLVVSAPCWCIVSQDTAVVCRGEKTSGHCRCSLISSPAHGFSLHPWPLFRLLQLSWTNPSDGSKWRNDGAYSAQQSRRRPLLMSQLSQTGDSRSPFLSSNAFMSLRGKKNRKLFTVYGDCNTGRKHINDQWVSICHVTDNNHQLLTTIKCFLMLTIKRRRRRRRIQFPPCA